MLLVVLNDSLSLIAVTDIQRLIASHGKRTTWPLLLSSLLLLLLSLLLLMLFLLLLLSLFVADTLRNSFI